MTISFDLPKDVENDLRKEYGDLSAAAKEALIIDAYRTGRLSLGHVAEVVGLPTSILAQRWLSDRGVPLNYSLGDLESDRRTLGKLFGDAV